MNMQITDIVIIGIKILGIMLIILLIIAIIGYKTNRRKRHIESSIHEETKLIIWQRSLMNKLDKNICDEQEWKDFIFTANKLGETFVSIYMQRELKDYKTRKKNESN